MPTRTRIKICGVRDAGTALAAIDAGADAIGLVFAKGSPREVTAAQAASIVRELPALVTAVALFVNPSVDEVRSAVDATGISTIQLHGKESPELAIRLRPLHIVKAIAFTGPEVRETLTAWRQSEAATNIRALLVDTPPKASLIPGHAGGTGQAFDWEMLAKLLKQGLWDGLPRLILAGGLTPSNVGEAIRMLRPYAVDVSSGVESSKGVKDIGMIRAFCRNVSMADGKLNNPPGLGDV